MRLVHLAPHDSVIDDDKVGVNDITDQIEAMEDDVQSVDMLTMQRCVLFVGL